MKSLLICAQLLKRDVVSTVATRVQMLLEDLLTPEEESKGSRDKSGMYKHTQTSGLSMSVGLMS